MMEYGKLVGIDSGPSIFQVKGKQGGIQYCKPAGMHPAFHSVLLRVQARL